MSIIILKGILVTSYDYVPKYEDLSFLTCNREKFNIIYSEQLILALGK